MLLCKACRICHNITLGPGNAIVLNRLQQSTKRVIALSRTVQVRRSTVQFFSISIPLPLSNNCESGLRLLLTSCTGRWQRNSENGVLTKNALGLFNQGCCAGLTPSQAFEAAIVGLDESTKKRLIPWTPDASSITATMMSNAPSLYRIQAKGDCVVARLMLPCFVHSLCGLVGCRYSSSRAVEYCRECTFPATSAMHACESSLNP